MISNLTPDEIKIIDSLFKKKYTAFVPYNLVADRIPPESKVT